MLYCDWMQFLALIAQYFMINPTYLNSQLITNLQIYNTVWPGHVSVLSFYLHDFYIVLEDITACTYCTPALKFPYQCSSQHGNIIAPGFCLAICIYGCSPDLCMAWRMYVSFKSVCVLYCIFVEFIFMVIASLSFTLYFCKKYCHFI